MSIYVGDELVDCFSGPVSHLGSEFPFPNLKTIAVAVLYGRRRKGLSYGYHVLYVDQLLR